MAAEINQVIPETSDESSGSAPRDNRPPFIPAESFDWENYTSWDDETVYSKTYIVNKKHPQASDDNPGTMELPFMTIGKAASIVKAGERVRIYSGVYREMVILKNQGQSKEKMICIEAAPGENVIVRGSRELNVTWAQNPILKGTPDENPEIYTWSRKIWFAALPDDLFEGSYHPFRLKNIEADEYDLMPWSTPTKHVPPYSLTRGMLFQNGRRLTQLAIGADLPRLPGSFWVAPDGKTICMHPFSSKDPSGDFFEAAVQSHLLCPEGVGFGYIRLSGLTFEHCANGFLRTATGAVNARGGHHWIIEGNTIRENNASGLEFGFYAFEPEDKKNPLNVKSRGRAISGGVIARNNTIYECGTAGIRSYLVVDGLIANNHIHHCGWQDAELHFEVAGIKLLLTRHTIVQDNHIHHIQGGNGIWLDWDNQYSRVTRNLIHDIQAVQGGIFIEASQYPNLVDNNLIWNIDGHGILGDDSDDSVYVHNLIADTTGSAVQSRKITDRHLHGRELTSERNTFTNNIFINSGAPIDLTSENNTVDNNLYVTALKPIAFPSSDSKRRGFDKNSRKLTASCTISEQLILRWTSIDNVETVPVIPFARSSYTHEQRGGLQTVPGPFAALPKDFRLLL